MTEMGAAWIPPLLKQLDAHHRQRAEGRDRRAEVHAPRTSLPRSATEYFHQNCWVGASQPGPADAAARAR